MHTQEERLKLIDQYVSDVHQLMQEIELPLSADESLQYLEHAGAYAYITHISPETGSWQGVKTIYEDSNPKLPLWILGIFPEDAEQCRAWREIWQLDCAAMYRQDFHCVALKSKYQTLSSKQRAITLLHEVGHGLQALRAGKIGKSAGHASEPITLEDLLDERDMHYMEHELWERIGGSSYQAIIDKAVYQMRKHLQKGKLKPGEARVTIPNVGNPFATAALACLTKMFGAPTSKYEANDWIFKLSLHANFAVIDRSEEPEKRTLQAWIMRSLYQEIREQHLRL